MSRAKMAIITVLTVALMMSWAVPVIAADMKKVNINKATQQELMSLNGIGEKIATRIVKFRTEKGPFQKPEDIMMVKGIGQKMFDKNKELILIK
jgi:competence protein ComEA